MRREQQPDQDAIKNETDVPPGLGGTNVRFPSKFLNNIYLVRGFFIGDNHFQNGRETIAEKDAFFALLVRGRGGGKSLNNKRFSSLPLFKVVNASLKSTLESL